MYFLPIFAMTFATFWVGWLFGYTFGSSYPNRRAKLKEGQANE